MTLLFCRTRANSSLARAWGPVPRPAAALTLNEAVSGERSILWPSCSSRRHPSPQAGRGPNRRRRYRSWPWDRPVKTYPPCPPSAAPPSAARAADGGGLLDPPSAWSRRRCGFTHWIGKASAGTTFMPTWTGPIDSLSRHGQRRHTHPAPTRNTHNCHRCPDASTVIDVLMQDCHRSPEARHCGAPLSGRDVVRYPPAWSSGCCRRCLPKARGVARS